MISQPHAWAVLLAGWASVSLCAGPVIAQEADKPAETKPAAEEKSTPWPPPNTVKQDPIKRTEDQATGLVLYTPKSWEKGKPANNLRLAEFIIPPAEGETEPVELAIFSFQGAGAGGGVQANVDRWINQFPGNDTKKTIVTGEGHQGLYVLVDLKGTYVPPPFVQGAKPMPNARMLAAIIGIRWQEEVKKDDADGEAAGDAKSESGNAGDDKADGEEKQTVTKSAVYFLKMVGSDKTVSANEEAFRRAFGAAHKSQENPIPTKDGDGNKGE